MGVNQLNIRSEESGSFVINTGLLAGEDNANAERLAVSTADRMTERKACDALQTQMAK